MTSDLIRLYFMRVHREGQRTSMGPSASCSTVERIIEYWARGHFFVIAMRRVAERQCSRQSRRPVIYVQISLGLRYSSEKKWPLTRYYSTRVHLRRVPKSLNLSREKQWFYFTTRKSLCIVNIIIDIPVLFGLIVASEFIREVNVLCSVMAFILNWQIHLSYG